MNFKIAKVPEFGKAVQLALKLGKKTEAEFLNDWALSVCIRAFRTTERATARKILQDMKRDALAMRIIWKRARLAGEKITREEAEARARRMVAARRKSVRYIGVGFLVAGKDFGGKGVKVNEASFVAKSSGIKATAAHLKAIIGNNARGAVEVAADNLEEAIRWVAQREIKYITRKLEQKAFRPVSGKR